ncbi:filamentous haemagglutinin-like protein [Beggiatoa sp. PS]|nr:filamentous haemagglutinin-like protein [Beggiatoa sp. PS]
MDVQGGFHASTADYLRLEDGGRFEARQPANSLLTIAPIQAFGFLTDSPATLTIEGSKFSVSNANTLTFIGGSLSITDAQLTTSFGRLNLASIAGAGEVIPQYEDLAVSAALGNLTVQSSEINTSGDGGGNIYIRSGQFLVSNSFIDATTLGTQRGGTIDIQAQDIFLTEGTGISTTTFNKGIGGDLLIKASNTVNITGGKTQSPSYLYVATDTEMNNAGNAGTLLIEAKDISFTEGSFITSSTWGPGQGGNVTLKATESVNFSGEDGYGNVTAIIVNTFDKSQNAGDAGTLLIEANRISFQDGASIFNNTFGQGNGGKVTLRANEQISFTGSSNSGYGSFLQVGVSIASQGGNAGNLVIETQDLLLTEGSRIFVPTFGPGKAGNITISATGNMTIVGTSPVGWESGISSVSNPKFIENEDGSLIPPTTNGGLGGNIAIEAQKLVLKEGGQISASSIAPEGLKSGDAGSIRIQADAIEISGVNPYGENEDGFGSGIYARSQGVDNNAGNAGQIVIEANSLTITNGGSISSDTNNQAEGGSIDIRVNGAIKISGDSSNIRLNEPAEAQLEYQAGFDDYTQGHSISGISASSSSEVAGAGVAGQIDITANTIDLANGGVINTSTQNASGGNLILTAFNRLYLRTAQVTTSVHGGTGKGGNIEIDKPSPIFVILNNGRIIAQADEGDGGKIRIIANQFIQTPDSIVSASSRLGLDGNVEIDSPDENVNEGVFDLSSSLLDASRMLDKPCEAMSYEEYQNRTRFVVLPIAGSPHSPFDLQPSRLSFAQKPTQTDFTHSQTTPQNITNHFPRPMMLTVCNPSQFQAETQAVKENLMPAQLF